MHTGRELFRDETACPLPGRPATRPLSGRSAVCLSYARKVVRAAADRGVAIAFPDVLDRRWARTLTDELKRGACHAGRYETSLVLAARPDLVRGEREALPPLEVDLAKAMRAGVRDFVAAGAAQAYFGDPAAATAPEGDEIYRRLVEMVVTTVEETWT